MKRLVALVAFALMGATSAPSVSPTPIVLEAKPLIGVVQVVVPKDESIVVRTTQGINSYSAATGEKIRYEIAQDFVVSGYLIAKAGDIAEGQVEEGQKGSSGGPYGIGYHAANLRVSVDRVYTFCGSTLELAFDRSEYRRRQGLWGSHQDVEIIKGQKYAASVDHPQTACAVKTDEQPQPIGSDVITSDSN